MSETKIAMKTEELKEIIQKIVIWNDRLLNMSVLHPQRYNHFIKRINTIDVKSTIDDLQLTYDTISGIMKDFGTYEMKDLLKTVIGTFYVELIEVTDKLMLKYCHPINYRIVKTSKARDRDVVLSKIKHMTNVDIHHMMKGKIVDFFELSRDHTLCDFIRVNGIRVAFNTDDNTTLIVDCICDDVILKHIQTHLKSKIDTSEQFHETLRLKELFIYEATDIDNIFLQNRAYLRTFERKDTQVIINEFVNDSIYLKRRTLMCLLLSRQKKLEYIGYLLYDLLGSQDETNAISNNNETFSIQQKAVYDLLPHAVKDKLNIAIQTFMMKPNSQSVSINNLSYEKQICLLDCDDSIKEKAIKKLAEVKSKDDTNSSKARQYLDALLKIPFGKYKCEYNYREKLRELLQIDESDTRHILSIVREKENGEIKKNARLIQKSKQVIETLTRYEFISIIKSLSTFIKSWRPRILRLNNIAYNKSGNIVPDIQYYIEDKSPSKNANKQNVLHYIKNVKLRHSGLRISELKEQVLTFFNMVVSLYKESICEDKLDEELYGFIERITKINIKPTNSPSREIVLSMRSKLTDVISSLDGAVHGHTRAKTKLQQIISQWMTGETNGYCLGFEGPPGVGKTSLAKYGIADCFVNDDGEKRPFGFIALGGSSRANVLVGHSYTYVGSSWGKIADILMETRCMNPIIYIDELDKISNTDYGQEIVGILTHLIDDTQNDKFQDRYLGFDIDLSKVLFIFSYNDVSKIDPILLDRIHRIRFDKLSLEDKYSVLNGYLMPELCRRFGFNKNWKDMIHIGNDVYKYIIEHYTNESGVRKLKEIMYEIVSSINIRVIQGCDLPVEVSVFDIENNYLKDRRKMLKKEIHNEPKVGCISGLWANSLGMGGVMMIQTVFIPSKDTLELKLTGMQGDVMKESMDVAKTVALKLANITSLEDYKGQSIHIHCPEGATPKDGPSAGGAICMALYSLFTGREIPNDIALTGELSLTGSITAIGGLEHKFVGGIRAGAKRFFYPVENEEDFQKFAEKWDDSMNEWTIQKGITFTPIENIEELRDAIFENE